MAMDVQQYDKSIQRVPNDGRFRPERSRTAMRRIVLALVAFLLVLLTLNTVRAQNGEPPPGAACVVSAGNRNAPLAADGSYTVFGIPGNLGAIRARATCSDGSIGQSAVGFTNPFQPDTIHLGPIVFGQIDPVPVAVTLTAPNRYLTTGQTSQLSATAVGISGATYDVTPRAQGTVYSISNDLLATVSEDGLVRIYPQFAEGSSSRVVVSSISEGGVASTYMYVLGPRGSLTGTVTASDGITPVVGAEVSVLRIQPMEQAGTAVTDAQGQFRLDGVNAGNFIVSAIEPATSDRAIAYSRIHVEGEVANVTMRLNGLGTVEVTVHDALDQPVPDTEVTFTALGHFRDVRALSTGANGKVGFANVAAGDFTVSARQPATRLIGTAVARVDAGQLLPITLKLQPIGDFRGRVFDVDGTTPREGVQVRIISRQRGILTQMLSAADGSYAFDTLPLSDGPFTLDAFVDGRLRARLPGNVIAQPNEILTRDIVLAPSGTVRGEVRRGGSIVDGATVRLQSLEGLRLAFESVADAQGRFRFPAVPVGDFELIATAPNGQNARVLGRVDTDGQEVAIDVVIADDTLAGTVYQRDGVTPVGSGVAVYLARKSLGARYTYANASPGDNVLATETDAQGRFGFIVAATGTYYVQAEQDLERGRSESIVVNLNPAQPLESRVVFLAKGTVRGQVRNTAGAIQTDVPVNVRSDGAFPLDRGTRTGPDGSYQLDGVFIGDLAVSARNEVTQLSGVSQGRLNFEGEQVVLDVTLAATATVGGTVIKRLGGAVTGPIRVTLRRDGSTIQTREFAQSQYTFPLVPIGHIEIEAEEIATGDRGIATTRIAGAGDNRNLNVTLVGQGRVDVRLIDDLGSPVVGARVGVSNSVPFQRYQDGLSDAQGRISFERVFAGDFSVSANKPLALGTLSGSAVGTLLPGATETVTVTMQNLIIGAVEGQLLQPDGVTPAGAGMVIRMLPEPFIDAFVTTTDGEGRYRFENVPAGTYTIDALRFYDRFACPNRDRVRARATAVSVQTQGDTVEANLTLIGQGQVRGRVTRVGGDPLAGVRITMTNPDPVYGANVVCGGGTTYVRTTDGNGEYLFEDAPPGDFTLDAATANGGLMAEGFGRVRFDTDIAIVDLELVDSAVTMPRTFHDSNGFSFNVQGHGGIGSGTNNVFAGAGPDNAGMRLEIVHNGVAVPFVNGDGTIGRIGRNGQQIDVDDITASGLFVRREAYVPRAGYFARYIEVLRNPSSDPITVDVLVKSHHRAAQSNPRVVDTSDGDQILSVPAGQLRDRWVVIDDQVDADPFAGSNSIPATAHVFDGDGAPVQVGAASYELIGQTGRLLYRWNQITVPAGGEVRLLHFALNQLDRFSARAAAMRLSSMPPEMLDDLTTEERQSVVNFVLPESSAMAPLPNLDAGRVHGIVYSGDGLTAVPNAEVRFKSKHPLFGRIRYRTTDAQGRFEYRSTLDGTQHNYVIPVFGFDLSARYEQTQAASALTPGDFDAGQTTEQQDLVFIGNGDVRGIVKRHNQSALAAATVRLCRLNNRSSCSDVQPNPSNQAISAADGGFLMLANPPRDYFLFAHKNHPQTTRYNGARPIYGEGQVTVTAGDIAVADVTMEQTGSIAGQVVGADLTPIVGAFVEIVPVPGNGVPIRGTTTDTFGRYRLFDVPLGSYIVRAEDDSSNAYGSGEATVSVDVESVADVTLRPFGQVRVQVNYARGIAAGGSRVHLGNLATGIADTNGRINLQAPEGTHTITAEHPDSGHPELIGSNTATITAPGQQVDVVVTLGPAAAVFGTIVRPDGTTLANGFPYSVRRLSGGASANRNAHTSNTGAFRQNGLPLGQYMLTAYDAGQDRYIDAEFALTEDGQEVELNLVLLENRIALPADLRDANRFRFDVQHSGALAQGSGAFSGGAAQLSVDGVAYAGETSARLEADRRQFLIAQPTPIAGLKVSRRIYVPRGAYFARYLEILENPGTEPRVVDVAIRHQRASGDVQATSSGDTVVGNGDLWVGIDDAVDEDILLANQQVSPTAFVFGAAGSPALPDLVGDAPIEGGRSLTTRWSAISVPPGGRVVLMHFIIQQINRAGMTAAIERTRQLPPELLADLGTEDRNTIANFMLPPVGTDTLPPLPSLTASVNGIVYEGDVRTPVRNVRVTVQSTHPLFNRVWGMHRDPEPICPPGTPVGSLVSVSTVPPNQQNPPPLGTFTLGGQLTASDSIALPEGVPVRLTAQEARGCFGYYSGHSWTYVPSRVETPVPSTTQNLIFDTGVLHGTAVGSADLSVTSGRMYLSTDDPDPLAYRYIPIAADGTWTYPGLLPGTYDVLFDTRHPNATGNDRLRGQAPGAIVNLAQIRVQDVTLQPTGRIQGAIVSATGEQSVAARVLLSGTADAQTYDQCVSGCVAETLAKHKGKREVSREVLTDSLGRYQFSAVPVGQYTMTVIDPISLGRTSRTLSVEGNQTTVQNVTLLPLGRAELTVLSRNGQPVIDAIAYLTADAIVGQQVAGRTDFLGRLTVANIPQGNYQLRITDPRNVALRYLDRTVTGTITMQGQIDNQPVSMLSVATLSINVFNGAVGSPGISGAQVRVIDARGTTNLANTNAQGDTTAVFVPEGTPLVRASAVVAGITREGEVPVVIGAAQDGQTIPVPVNLADALVPLPKTLHDANRSAYNVPADGGGSYLPHLRIAGTPFTGAANAAQQVSQRQYAITQTTPMSGLRVTRKVFVPRNGYFARYLEVLENEGAGAVVVDVEVRTQLNYDQYIHETSNGNTTADQDLWVTYTRSGGDYAETRAALFADAPERAPIIDVIDEGGIEFLRARWIGVSVPPASRRTIMHFLSLQHGRAAARASAERLMQLPPEAIDGLLAEAPATITGFAVPADGNSALSPLPSLLGRISGVVRDGDGTPLAESNVTLRSGHPLFVRDWDRFDVATLRSAANGAFSIDGVVNDTATSIPLPVDSPVTFSASHPQAGSMFATATGTFAVDGTMAQELLFNAGVVHGTVSGAFQYPAYAGFVEVVGRASTSMSGDGSYRIGGVAAGSLSVRATLVLPDGDDLVATVSPVTVVAGVAQQVDIVLPPNGAVRGIVRTSDGQPLPNATIQFQVSGTTRNMLTNAQGQYAFNAARAGSGTIRVTDPRSQAQTTLPVTVTANQESIVDFDLPAIGTLNVTLLYARGEPVVGRSVYLSAPSIQGQSYIGFTDGVGKLTASAPVGPLTLHASNPTSGESATFDTSLDTDGQVRDVTFVLPPTARVSTTVLSGGVPVADAFVQLRRATDTFAQASGNTDANGEFLTGWLDSGTYQILAFGASGSGFETVQVDTAHDNQTIPITLNFGGTNQSEGILSFNNERHLHGVMLNAGDELSLTAIGAAVAGTDAICAIRVAVYGPNQVRLAEGIGNGPSGYSQSNVFGDLRRIVATQTGRHFILVRREYSYCQVGGYRLFGMRNGEAATVDRNVDGGRIEGRVLRADTVTPIGNAIVRLRNHGVIGIHEQVRTDAEGRFVYPSVRTGSFDLSHWSEGGNESLVAVNGSLDQPGNVVTQDLVLPPITTINVTVREGAEGLTNAEVILQSQSVYVTRLTGEGGMLTYTYRGASDLTVRARHPQHHTVQASTTVVPGDGQTRDVELMLAHGGIQGVVRDAEGNALPDILIEALLSPHTYVASTTTSATGEYQFPALASASPIMLLARDPLNYVQIAESVTPVAGAMTTRDLVLPGRGSVALRVVNESGSPIPYVTSFSSFETRLGSGDYTTHEYGQTNEDGERTIGLLPVGRPIRIVAEYYAGGGARVPDAAPKGEGGGNYITAEATVTLTSSGQVLPVELVLDVPGRSRVVANVTAADALPIGGYCYLYVEPGNGSYGEGGCDEELILDDLPTGDEHLVRVLREGNEIHRETVIIQEGVDVEVSPVLSVVHGLVTHPEGGSVGNGWYYIEDSAASYHYGNTEVDGRFRAIGIPAGPLRINVTDNDSGLQVQGTGDLQNAGGLLEINVTMPDSGTVRGTVRDAGGAPVAQALIDLRNATGDMYRTAETDAAGVYVVPRMLLGPFVISARKSGTALFTGGSGTLATHGDDVTVDLHLPVPGAITGELRDAQNAVLAGQCVELRAQRVGFGFDELGVVIETGPAGEYSIAEASPGSYLVSAYTCVAADEGAIAEVTVMQGQTSNAPLTWGTALSLPRQFVDPVSGLTQDIGANGNFSSWLMPDYLNHAFESSPHLTVAQPGQPQMWFPWRMMNSASDAGRTFDLGPALMGDLSIRRRIHVPVAGGHVRVLESVTNLSGSPITPTIAIDGEHASGALLFPAAPALPLHHAVQATNDPGAFSAPSVAAYVFGSAGAAHATSVDFQSGRGSFRYHWAPTIAPGQTVSMLHYWLVGDPAATTSVQQRAEAMSNLVAPGMFDGLSAAERARIINFQVPVR